MTTALIDAQSADRLCKLLGLLGSHHDGEVLAAARTAHEFIRQAGLIWPDIIKVPTAPNDWQHMAKFCRNRAHRLTPRNSILRATLRLVGASLPKNS